MNQEISASALYELINERIKEIENEMLKTSSTLLLRHLQKALEHNRLILAGTLLKDDSIETLH